MSRIFQDRRAAGKALAEQVSSIGLKDPLVLGLPRGGLPVAREVATALDAPLDVLVVRKLGAPFQPELAVGAIASGGLRVLNEELVGTITGMDESVLEDIVNRETAELERRERLYRGDRPFPSLEDRNVVLVDDGMATGATMRAAVEAVRSLRPASVIVAVPTGSKSAIRQVEELADKVICLEAPADFYAVGQFYVDFSQTTDAEVRDILEQAAADDS